MAQHTDSSKTSRTVAVILAMFLLALGAVISSGTFGLNWSAIGKTGIPFITFLPHSIQKDTIPSGRETVKVVSEESVVIDVVDKASPSVVTVGISTTARVGGSIQFDPFDFFSPFQEIPGTPKKIEQDIGSGFIVESNGLVVTNKHVVSDTQAKYRIITKDDKTFDVVRIYRDPVNDLAILKINATGLIPITMGDSSKIKVGQLAIAIGTALGEFRNTVTTGVVSGIGRGITAGSIYEGSVERLDNVIQTSAAISPGNSGGPLLDSSGRVIGVNTAVSSEGQNIGFAIPINIVKEALDTFNKTGQFNRPFLGVRYKVITKDLALLNDVPEGAYIMDVVEGSPAERGGIEVGDIVIKISGTKLSGKTELSTVIGSKKAGERVTIILWREGKEIPIDVTLGTQDQ